MENAFSAPLISSTVQPYKQAYTQSGEVPEPIRRARELLEALSEVSEQVGRPTSSLNPKNQKVTTPDAEGSSRQRVAMIAKSKAFAMDTLKDISRDKEGIRHEDSVKDLIHFRFGVEQVKEEKERRLVGLKRKARNIEPKKGSKWAKLSKESISKEEAHDLKPIESCP